MLRLASLALFAQGVFAQNDTNSTTSGATGNNTATTTGAGGATATTTGAGGATATTTGAGGATATTGAGGATATTTGAGGATATTAGPGTTGSTAAPGGNGTTPGGGNSNMVTGASITLGGCPLQGLTPCAMDSNHADNSLLIAAIQAVLRASPCDILTAIVSRAEMALARRALSAQKRQLSSHPVITFDFNYADSDNQKDGVLNFDGQATNLNTQLLATALLTAFNAQSWTGGVTVSANITVSSIAAGQVTGTTTASTAIATGVSGIVALVAAAMLF